LLAIINIAVAEKLSALRTEKYFAEHADLALSGRRLLRLWRF